MSAEGGEAAPPALAALFGVFAALSIVSVGGGLQAHIHRAVVGRRGWMSEANFVTGTAIARIAPGPNAVNLAVFTGATLRGAAGAAAALGGLVLPALAIVLAIGALLRDHAPPPPLAHALAGLGAGAVGLAISNGVALGRVATRRPGPLLLAAGTAGALVCGAGVLPTVLVALPLSLVLSGGGGGGGGGTR